MNKITRHCFDPWEYIEFRTDGRLSPCCIQPSFIEPFTNLGEYRNISEFRELRQNLLEGNLDFKCQNCHLREKISVDEFQQKLKARYSDSLSAPQQLAMVRIDFTERCNLRCTYCATSQPGYNGVEPDVEQVPGGREMPHDKLEKIIQELADYPHIDEIAVNGHGETTFYKGWSGYCSRLLDIGHKLTIICNFARQFDTEEIAALSRFKSITISIDTEDPLLLKQIRRKVDLGNILANMFRIRAKALADGRKKPDFIFLSGVYDKNVTKLDELAWFAVACDVKEISFWKLLKYPDVPQAQNVQPIYQLKKEQFLRAFDTLKRTEEILTTHGIKAVGLWEDINTKYQKYISLKISAKNFTEDSCQVSVMVRPHRSHQDEKINFYAVNVKDDIISFLPENGPALVWDTKTDDMPSYRTITRKEQEVTVEFPVNKYNSSLLTYYVGCGKTVSEVMENENYMSFRL